MALFFMILTIATSILAFSSPQRMSDLVLHPYSVMRGRNIYTLVTGNLIHADIPHLLFNMMSYYFFAFSLENIVGSTTFAIIYVISMLASNIPSLLNERNNDSYYTLGASGAVSGIIFSSILFHPLSKMSFLFLPIGIPAILFGVLYLAYSFYVANKRYDNINHYAHAYGAIGGIVATLVLVPDALQIFLTSLSLFNQ